MSNRDRFVLQFQPKFYLLFTPTRLPLNQTRRLPSASRQVMPVHFNWS